MQSTVRTTIILPEDLLRQAKLTAVYERKPLSAIIREALEEKLSPQKASQLHDHASQEKEVHMKLGKYSFGTKNTFHRKDIYASQLKRKVSA